MRNWETQPFQKSLETLAQIALHEIGARGYAFFHKSRNAGSLIRLTSGGSVVPDATRDRSAPDVVEYPLVAGAVVDASVAFTFASKEEAVQARTQLDRIAATIQTIWATAATERYSDLVDRVADLETRLMDSKIADRAVGFLTDRTNPDPAELIAKHVEGVLRPTQTRRILEQALLELEEEIDERTLVSRAKQILQATKGVSEEEAHAQLRIASRRLRRRLKDVALQVIEDQQRPKGKTA